MWDFAAIAALGAWLFVARSLKLTSFVRCRLQPLVASYVEDGVPFVLFIQKYRHPWLDLVLSAAAGIVSIEFYTALLPLLFWAGHNRLARHMTMLMALCIYIGNSLKDTVSAPRPPSPPVRRVMATQGERECSFEYGLPSSHTMNTVCMSLYLVMYLADTGASSLTTACVSAGLAPFVFVIVVGRLYLGMHSLVDVVAGAVLGIIVPLLWRLIQDSVDEFIIHYENLEVFQTCLAVLLLHAYPVPEYRTPSYQYHTAFNGVVLGLLVGIHRTNLLFDHNSRPVLSFITLRSVFSLLKRLAVGYPIILLSKAVSKATAIHTVPVICALLGVPVTSTSYVSSLTPSYVDISSLRSSSDNNTLLLGKKDMPDHCRWGHEVVTMKKRSDGGLRRFEDGTDALAPDRPFCLQNSYSEDSQQQLAVAIKEGSNLTFLEELAARRPQHSTPLKYDVDIAIQFLSYIALGWAVVEVCPRLFHWLGI